MSNRVYAAFFLGQGGYWFSMSFAGIAEKLKTRGVTVDIYTYEEYAAAMANIALYRARGYKIALVGYSLGCTTATYLQTMIAVDLLICIAESTLAENHPVNKKNTKRARLFMGPDFLSSAGSHDGFDPVTKVNVGFGIPVLSHLLVPSIQLVIDGVLKEFADLQQGA